MYIIRIDHNKIILMRNNYEISLNMIKKYAMKTEKQKHKLQL